MYVYLPSKPTYSPLTKVFLEYNKGDLDSYLIEITAQIFGKKEDDGSFVVDNILDVAGQKGTGKKLYCRILII